MTTLVTELKKEVLDESLPVSTLLRKALLTAKALDDKENEQWISAELKGYLEEVEIPEYRTLFGQPVVRDHYSGWQYVYTHNLDPEIAEKLSYFNFRSPIAELESYSKEKAVVITYDTRTEQMLMRALSRPGLPAIQFSGVQFQKVLGVVRNRLLEWTSSIPEEKEPQGAPQEQSVAQSEETQPTYNPTGLKGYMSQNKDWMFQGIGTEILKWIGGGLLIIASFFLGSYLNKPSQQKQVDSTTPTSSISPTPTATPTPIQTPTPTPTLTPSIKWKD
jgi:hypothetical protein